MRSGLKLRKRYEGTQVFSMESTWYNLPISSLVLCWWTDRKKCIVALNFAPLYFQCQKYRNTCACHWRVCFPLGNPNARCPFMERMTTRALSLGVETRRTEATWQTIRNASKLAKDHKKPLAGLHESWCIYHRGTYPPGSPTHCRAASQAARKALVF